MSPSPALFQPIQVGDMHLAHRVVMAPLTRFRADENHVPLPFMAEYYAQRSSVPGTLLISEATFIAPQAGGFANVPGIWNEQQIAEWKKVTDAVHKNKSFIYLQLWALGRAASPRQLAKESKLTGQPLPYVSASPLRLSTSNPSDPTPQALTLTEISQYVEFYAQAAENAVHKAGFDGVEIHGANGYLVDQFLQDVSNKRTDKYGGSVENRARFGLEVLDAVVKRVGPKNVGLRMSPWSPYQDMGMKDPVPTYTHYIKQIIQRHPDLAYIHATEKRMESEKGPNATSDTFVAEGTENDFIRELWSAYGTNGRRLITAGGYTRDTGMRVSQRKGDLIAYGRLFISNPELPYRLEKGLKVDKGDRSTYYNRADPKGYTDYPFSPEFLNETDTARTGTRILARI
ncbi:hypothetical protein M413DRAFT_443761 [Hebeloma cylindrosporum]|uniref:NADH:flavin oxidoreductase/NADH oxidase N-terminal domain-containing protein n=1 Tax=Hebeloma cylindrosporum TaxID=76867 RepID=A0A0C3CJF3_HEBCY|nr:hypothetical protein M413DRAFT_443761 [Hebeloma cylindrosporum h7]